MSVSDTLDLGRLHSVRSGGELRDRIERSIEHERELEMTPLMWAEFDDPDADYHWGADYVGRWVGAMSLAEAHTQRDLGVAPVARKLIAQQRRDGSFGAFSEVHDEQEWFGMGRGLIGLLEYYTVSGDEAALESAKKLGDYYERSYPSAQTDFFWECYSSGLEGLVVLAERADEPRYLAVAERVAGTSPVFRLEWFSEKVGRRGLRAPIAGQVHCQVSTARGLVDLSRATGDDRYLAASLALHDYIRREALWVSGGVPEWLVTPSEENETCADVDWLRLNLLLWEATSDPQYLDLAETTWRNQLYFDQADTGAFCYLRGLNGRAGSVFDSCCSHHGLRGLLDIVSHIYTNREGAIQVNFLTDSAGVLATPGGLVEVETSVAERTGELVARIRVVKAPSHEMPLFVRIPAWSRVGHVTVNTGESTEEPGSRFASRKRVWKTGDTVEVKLPLDVRVLRGERVGDHVLREDVAAISLGPWLFCLNEAANPHVLAPFIRLHIPEGETGISALRPTDLQVRGMHKGKHVDLTLTRLADVGGVPRGIGRIHKMISPQFRAWLPTT